MFTVRPLGTAPGGSRLRGALLATPSSEGPQGGLASADRSARSLRLTLDPSVDAAGKAREALERLDDQIERGVLQDLHLLVTELVTNSIRHSGADPDHPVHVEVSLTGDLVFVAVEDGGGGFEPAARSPDSPRDSGWGLHLVERLSSRWGVSRSGGTRVWLELPRARRPEAA